MASQQIPVCTANPVKIALCQISVGTDKSENIKTASKAITEAAANADIIILPEIWNSPYDTASFPRYAEVIPDTAAELKQSEHPSSLALSQLAEAVGK
jgi:omega-amidase